MRIRLVFAVMYQQCSCKFVYYHQEDLEFVKVNGKNKIVGAVNLGAT